jgi:drug/metabolite transporter superfamily protein YnfA
MVDRNLRINRKDRTGVFFVAALCVVGFSYAVDVLSVHTYCENRPFAGALALAAVVNCYLLLRSWPAAGFRRALSASGVVFCVLAIAANVGFVIWATHTCRHMFDLLNS